MKFFAPMLIATSLLGALSGCVTPQKAQGAMQDRFVGQPADAFFSRYGMPQASFAQGGSTLYRWRGGETSLVVPLDPPKAAKPDAVASGTGASHTSTTSQVSTPNPNTTVRETTTTRFSIDVGALLNPQTQAPTSRTVPIFCEAQITVDPQGRITAIQTMQDTRGVGLSLSRCAEVFDVK